MKDKVDVLGILVDGYYVEEVLEKIDQDWRLDGFYTYGIITMNLLMAAKEDMQLTRYIEMLDASIIGEIEVLEAAQIQDERMIREVTNQEFMGTIFLYAIEYQNSVFILGENKEETDIFCEYMRDTYEGINIAGSDYLHMDEADCVDRVINEINSVSPEFVLTCTQGFTLERFAVENRKKINTKMWLSLGNHPRVQNDMGLKSGWLSKLLEKSAFKKMVSKYNSEKENDKS